MLERENALAFWLLVPTLVILTLFIAYPFARGVWLSLTNSVVGVPGEFSLSGGLPVLHYLARRQIEAATAALFRLHRSC